MKVEVRSGECIVVSLGAGVQSSVMALMADDGAFGPVPDFAIFADTGWEPPHVYAQVEWLDSQLSYPVYRAAHPKMSLRDSVATITSNSGDVGFIDIPVFLSQDGMSKRQCTRNWKITPIRRKVRQLLGVGPHDPVDVVVQQMIGISTDEIARMKDSGVQYVINCFPLVEAGMSRRDCLDWWAKHYPGRQLAKSACVGCPYQSPARWVHTKREYPEIFADLVAIDANLRESAIRHSREAFLHSARLPLAEAVALTEAQASDSDAFDNECEGICGV